ncbi:hypothetical protein ACFLRO_01030 [Bacteroidota bacterium]
MKRLVIVAIFAIAGCGPKVGDVYEHKLDRQRIQIKGVKECRFLRARVTTGHCVSYGDYNGYTALKGISLEVLERDWTLVE